jgi:hypothetical protein
MKQPKEYRTIFGTQYEVMNYEGVELRRNPLTNLWMFFFNDSKIAPWSGKLKEVKEIVDDFKKREMLDILRQY